ncbi:MAG: two-component system sensor histidine kinase NtrB [Promethearchaeota archaeon]
MDENNSEIVYSRIFHDLPTPLLLVKVGEKRFQVKDYNKRFEDLNKKLVLLPNPEIHKGITFSNMFIKDLGEKHPLNDIFFNIDKFEKKNFTVFLNIPIRYAEISKPDEDEDKDNDKNNDKDKKTEEIVKMGKDTVKNIKKNPNSPHKKENLGSPKKTYKNGKGVEEEEAGKTKGVKTNNTKAPHKSSNKMLEIETDKEMKVEVNIYYFGNNLFLVSYKYDLTAIRQDLTAISGVEFGKLDFNIFDIYFADTQMKAYILLENNKIVYANKNFMDLLGYKEEYNVLGRRIEEFIDQTYLNDVIEFFETLKNNPRPKKNIEIKVIKKSGKLIWAELYIVKLKIIHGSDVILCYFRDISAKKKNELMLLQAHQLAAVGELTLGIGHEINNPLFGILNYAELIKEEIEEGHIITTESEEFQYLLGIIKEAKRIDKIIKTLSEFSRRSEEITFVSTDLKEVIANVEKILRYHLNKNHVFIKKDFDPKLRPVLLQKYRIENVFFNLVKNSIHAFEAIKDRRHEILIKIRIKKLRDLIYTSKESNSAKHIEEQLDKLTNVEKKTSKTKSANKDKVFKKEMPYSSGDELNFDPDMEFLIINFRDNGIGIEDKNIIKIFNPFFTTKRAYKGMGLGLHTVYNVIKDHDGTISVSSEYGEFTEFEIKIPIRKSNG